MKQEVWAKNCKELLKKNGFQAGKPHEYRRVQDGVLAVISFQGKKNDIYVWYAMYPLAMPDIWTSRGYNNATGRFPLEENTIAVIDGNIESAKKQIFELVKSYVLPAINGVGGLKELACLLDNSTYPTTQYPRAFCLFDIGKVQEGFKSLDIVNNLKQPSLREERRHIESLKQLDSTELASKMEKFKKSNVQKLRLSKLM